VKAGPCEPARKMGEPPGPAFGRPDDKLPHPARGSFASAYRTPVPWQRWHFTTLSPFLTKPLPSQFLHLDFFLTFGPFSLAMMVTKGEVRPLDCDRRIRIESLFPRHTMA
jgi:hypothetical protein